MASFSWLCLFHSHLASNLSCKNSLSQAVKKNLLPVHAQMSIVLYIHKPPQYLLSLFLQPILCLSLLLWRLLQFGLYIQLGM